MQPAVPRPARDLALTLFQPPGAGVRIALVTGRGVRAGRVDWVRLDGVDMDGTVDAAFDLGRARGAVAVVTGAPALPKSGVGRVLGACLAKAGFDGLAPGREVPWSAVMLAAE